MGDITKILAAVGDGNECPSSRLFPLLYQELRDLAKTKLSRESSGQSLQPTMLVHEAYARLVGQSERQCWQNRGHFFAAAAEAMRRILVEHARRRATVKRGGGWDRVPWELAEVAAVDAPEEVLELNEALEVFEAEWPEKAKLVKLRYFGGLTIPEAAESMGISTATAERYWRFSRAWLHNQLRQDQARGAKKP